MRVARRLLRGSATRATIAMAVNARAMDSLRSPAWVQNTALVMTMLGVKRLTASAVQVVDGFGGDGEEWDADCGNE